MNQCLDLAHSLQVAVAGLLVSTRGLGSLRAVRFPDRRWLAGRAIHFRTWVGTAFREAAREQKVALLGLVLVLAALTWP